MRRFWMILGAVVLVMLALFAVAQIFGLQAMMTGWIDASAQRPLLAGSIGLGLLVADVLLPVPATVILLYLGYAFGLAGGSALGLLGCVLSAVTAYGIGMAGGPLLDRLLAADERARADRLLQRYGLLAVVITRPIPMLAEAVALFAGSARIGARRVAGAAAAGALPVVVIHAWAGARFGVSDALSGGLVAGIFALVLAVSGVFWWLGRRI